MYSITINAKTSADLAKVAALLDGQYPVKELADFGLQDIADYLIGQGYGIVRPDEIRTEPKTLDVLLKEDEAKELKKASRKAQKVTVTETAENLETAETEGEGDGKGERKVAVRPLTTDTKSASEDLDPKEAAIKEIMRVYTKPEGKKLANDLLKEFGCKNFHLVPDDRAQEFHDKTMAAISAAGL